MNERELGDLKHDVEVENVTPAQAAEYLDEQNFERNRPLVEDTAVHYADQMSKGTFLTATPLVFAHVREDDRYVLMNGQHRLKGVVLWGSPMRFTSVTYYLATNKQLAKLYATIDIGRSRNLSDNIRAHALPDVLNLPQAESSRLTSAVSVIKDRKGGFRLSGRSRGNRSYAEMIEDAKDWRREGRWYFDLIKRAPKTFKPIATRQAVIASAFITLRGSKTKAEQFWQGVILLDNIPSNDVRHLLHNKLLEVCARRERGHSRTNYINSHGVASLICAAWNAFIANKEVQILRPVKSIGFNRCNWREEK